MSVPALSATHASNWHITPMGVELLQKETS